MRFTPNDSAREHVTGAALYTEDLAHARPGVLYAWPVQSRHAHAQVVDIRSGGACEVDGFVRLLTAQDVPGENEVGTTRPDEALFPAVVRYHGQALSWVLASNERASRLAAERVEVEYEPLPAVLCPRQAAQAGDLLCEPQRIQRGSPSDALRSAPHRLQGGLELGGQEHFYLEPHGALAVQDEVGAVLVHSSTQHPTETQAIVARVLGLPNERIVCQSLRMGGAFGGKELQANAFAAVAAVGLHATGRPVCVRLERTCDMTISGKRHPFVAQFEVGFADDGKLLALEVDLLSDGGYSLDLSAPIMARALFHIDNCYFIEHLSVTGRVARTNHPSNTAFRGFGGPQAMVVIEDILDRVARTLGLDPREVRERNFYRAGDTTHYGQPVRDAERIERIWVQLLADADVEARAQAIAGHNAGSQHQKRGIAITPVKFGISFTTAFFNQAGALVLVYRDGSVQVNHGGTEMGQGLHTKIHAVATRALQVDPSAVRVMPTRTDKVPNTSATAASSGSDLNGAAVHDACAQIRGRLLPVAAELLGCPEDEVHFERGRVQGGGTELPFSELVEAAYLRRIPLFATGFYRTPGLDYDSARGRGTPFHYFAYGAAVAEVEVDTFTGQYRVCRVDILHDVGDSLSEQVDRGQIEGGFVQGMGWLTSEELCWGEQGQLLTRGPSTYKVPSAADCPPIFNVHLLERAHQPDVIYGSKAVGEPPFMLAMAVREALRAAVAAARGGGPVELGSPATPEQVYWALRGGRSAAQSSSQP
ncbi:MAG: xanthine dehydrogenase molybdopterin binding subunit [Myxococcales bacterium]|nr:xanthine dehydrogenase molybdopterin binding subunit [Myxococcales bacterium]